MLPEPLDQVPSDQEIASVTANGAFDTRKCHRRPWYRSDHSARQERQTLEARQSRRNRPKRGPRASQRFGRTIWRR